MNRFQNQTITLDNVINNLLKFMENQNLLITILEAMICNKFIKGSIITISNIMLENGKMENDGAKAE